MAEKTYSNVGYLLAGVTIGWLIGIFFAPKTGEKVRAHLSKNIRKGHKHARKVAREFRERAEDALERGKELVNQKQAEIAEKLHAAVEAHMPEKAKGKSA